MYRYEPEREHSRPAAGVPIGSGWEAFTAVLAPGDFSGDGRPDLLELGLPPAALLMYRGDGDGGFLTGGGEPIGSGWETFSALLAPGDFSGDGSPDVLARRPDGGLLLYPCNGAGGFAAPGQQVGSGWQSFTALFAGGDFSGDGKARPTARRPDGGLPHVPGQRRGRGSSRVAASRSARARQPSTVALVGETSTATTSPTILARAADGALLPVPR